MSTTLVIAARELRGKGRLLVISAALALVPFLAALMPAARGNRGDVIALFGGFLAVAVGLGLAVALGSSTIGRELSERRLSFYLTRPASGPAIWAGKAIAAILTALAGFAVIALPAFLAAPKAWRIAWLGGAEPPALAAVGIVGLFLISHALSTVIRSRSILLAVDFVALCGAVAAIVLLVVPLLRGQAIELAGQLLLVIAIAVGVILAVAPAWQLARGRTDVRRSHLEFSRFFWTSVAVVLLVATGVVSWVVSAGPEDVTGVRHFYQSPTGSRFLLTGETANRGGHTASFVIEPESRSTRRVPQPWWGVSFSRDGRVVAWVQSAMSLDARRMMIGSTLELCVLAPGADGPAVIGPRFSYSAVIALSDDGSNVAVADRELLSVYDTVTGKLLAAAAGLNPAASQTPFFASADLVRVVEESPRGREPMAYRVLELDIKARSMRQTGEGSFAVAVQGRRGVSVSGDGTRLWLRGAGTIVDGRSVKPIAQLPIPGQPMSVMLHDGSVAATSWNEGQSRLLLFAPDGGPLHDLLIPSEGRAFVVGETTDGKLILRTNRQITGQVGTGRSMLVVDLTSGVIERTVPDVNGPLPSWSEPRAARYEAGVRFVAVDAKGELITWDPRSGEKKKLEL